MSHSTIPGLVGEIANYICESAYMTNRPFAEAAAIAAMSSFSASRYLVIRPDCCETRDREPQVVYQGAMLVGQSCGKGCTFAAVSALFEAIGDDALVSGFSEWTTLWQRAGDKRGILWLMEHEDHHQLIRRDPYYSECFVGTRLSPKESDALVALQRSAHLDVATRPNPTRSERNRHYIPSSPVTILSESTPAAFREKLPIEWVASHFLGKLLMAYDQQQSPIFGSNAVCPPSPDLIKRLRAFTGRRDSKEQILVEWDELTSICFQVDIEVLEVNGLLREVDWFKGESIRELVINVAAIIAIGAGPEHPVITMEILATAFNIAEAAYATLRAALEVEPVTVELEH